MSYLYSTAPFYVYRIDCKPTGQYYFGSRYGHVSGDIWPEDDIWKRYFTSSHVVKDLISIHTTSQFEATIIKTGHDREEIYWAEQMLIQEHIQDPLCINQTYTTPDGTRRMNITAGLTKWVNTVTGKYIYAKELPGEGWVAGKANNAGKHAYHKDGKTIFSEKDPGDLWNKGGAPRPESSRYGLTPNTNKIWYNNGIKSIMRREHPGDGWVCGRLTWKRNPKPGSPPNPAGSANRGKKAYNNGHKNIMCKDHPGPGWVEGQLQTHTTYLKRSIKAKGRKHTQGMMWYNDGIQEKLIRDLPPQGWVRGKISNKKTIGTKWFNNGINEARVKESPGDGWVLGRLIKT